MFHEIDENTWDRKEIYDAFYGYTYAMTVQLDTVCTDERAWIQILSDDLLADHKDSKFRCGLPFRKSPWYNRIL